MYNKKKKYNIIVKMSDNELTLDDMNELGITDNFWFDDISVLYDPQRFIEFIPTDDMLLAEKLNTIVRYCFYISIILIIYTGNISWIMIFLLSMIGTYYLYYSKQEKFQNKSKTKKDCTLPTNNNPFMNHLMYDTDFSPNSYSCPYTKKVKQKINDIYYKDLPRNFLNTDTNLHGERNFYTMPDSINKRDDL